MEKLENNQKKIVRFIALNLLLFFVLTYWLSSSDTIIYDTDARYEVTKSIVERADLSIPDDFGIRGADGRVYSWFGLGGSVLAIPFYIMGKYIGTPAIAVSLMNQIFGAVTVVLIFLFAIGLGYSRRASLLVSIFYGLGTMAWPLAKQPFDHTIETFFILLSVYCLYLYVTNRKISNLLFSAFSLGFAFITRPTSILVIPPLFIMLVLYSVKRFDRRTVIKMILRDSVMFFLVFLSFLSLNLWYDYYRFGSIFETGYTLLSARTGIDYFRGTSLLTGLSGFLISPGKGFFYYSPVTILFFFSIKSFIKKHFGLGISFIFIIISYLFFLSKYVYWHGDWAWGPRYIFVLTPFFILPIAELVDSEIWQRSNIQRVAVYSIFILSLVIQIAAVSVDFKKYFFDLQLYKKVKFTVASGEGIQPIVVPPEKIYFDFEKSSILAQFKFIFKISKEIKNYRYLKLPDNAPFTEKLKVYPYLNIFDFWWLYKYFVGGSYSGFYIAFFILILNIYTAVNLLKLSHIE
jgi:4-amino-4-deoxy-L-arabinose transferase-like glycosyltransferase